MDFDFGFSLYFLDPPKLEPLERFFVQVQGKISIYKKHAETTIGLYHTEATDKLKDLKAEHKKVADEANVAYKKHFDEIDGSEDDKHAWALHASGAAEIDHHYASADEDMKADFTEMADHFNKSSLVTLYALLETELRRLCGHLHNSFKLKFTVERFEKTDYLKSMMEYISLVAEIDIASTESKINKLQELQYLRNRIMHNGAEFSLEKNEWLDDLVKNSDGGLFWENVDEEQIRILRIRSKFISPYYSIISNFFFELFKSLNVKLGFNLLSERMSFLFGFLSKEINVKYISQRDISNGKQFVFSIESNDLENLFKFNCKMSITASNPDQLIITNQLDEIKNMERWIIQMQSNSAVFRQALVGFLPPNSTHKIDIMLYP
ncbi:hypothetical protein [Pedobacter chitinilyticus]|uniref:Uncharacterized protein n=1 Tax=Pedobacter chitinilyticus TaxID=2233776 RepID=A0A3S3SUI1_9SPHI|nr:hypothetical protein [Pedobacter chitinilyticus]RWU10662.1 hypothetical protein DPV69_04805 [Pedobacter chitinilyticus]